MIAVQINKEQTTPAIIPFLPEHRIKTKIGARMNLAVYFVHNFIVGLYIREAHRGSTLILAVQQSCGLILSDTFRGKSVTLRPES